VQEDPIIKSTTNISHPDSDNDSDEMALWTEPFDIEPYDIEPFEIDPYDIEPSNIEPSNIEPFGIEPFDINSEMYRPLKLLLERKLVSIVSSESHAVSQPCMQEGAPPPRPPVIFDCTPEMNGFLTPVSDRLYYLHFVRKDGTIIKDSINISVWAVYDTVQNLETEMISLATYQKDDPFQVYHLNTTFRIFRIRVRDSGVVLKTISFHAVNIV
jgi:hypothetical protein